MEGDSAGGSAKTARNRTYQAILPIRGKILNVEKASIDKVLANAEIKTMINAFGCGFSEGYEMTSTLRSFVMTKLLLWADADVDGAHISTLAPDVYIPVMRSLSNRDTFIWPSRLFISWKRISASGTHTAMKSSMRS